MIGFRNRRGLVRAEMMGNFSGASARTRFVPSPGMMLLEMAHLSVLSGWVHSWWRAVLVETEVSLWVGNSVGNSDVVGNSHVW